MCWKKCFLIFKKAKDMDSLHIDNGFQPSVYHIQMDISYTDVIVHRLFKGLTDGPSEIISWTVFVKQWHQYEIYRSVWDMLMYGKKPLSKVWSMQ